MRFAGLTLNSSLPSSENLMISRVMVSTTMIADGSTASLLANCSAKSSRIKSLGNDGTAISFTTLLVASKHRTLPFAESSTHRLSPTTRKEAGPTGKSSAPTGALIPIVPASLPKGSCQLAKAGARIIIVIATTATITLLIETPLIILF
ncbi:MAG: hypothetical protein ACD_39C01106G0002 [uncultured bacterium]|nr:MAG: hypothetical protein ACD_39C01106G0002 [uncultured bacterium]